MTADRDCRPDSTTADEPASRSSSARTGAGRDRRAEQKHLPVWQETILLLGIALVLAIVIKALFVQAFYIPSESMEPGLVRTTGSWCRRCPTGSAATPQRGDVVVFKDPGGWLDAAEAAGPTSPVAKVLAKVGLYPTGGHLVKRVIGVGGDVIKCCDEQGRITVNGEPLDEEDYVQHEAGVDCAARWSTGCDWTAGPVPEGHIFVMGDNRGHSADSTRAHVPGRRRPTASRAPSSSPSTSSSARSSSLLWPRDHSELVHRPDTFEDVPDASS